MFLFGFTPLRFPTKHFIEKTKARIVKYNPGPNKIKNKFKMNAPQKPLHF